MIPSKQAENLAKAVFFKIHGHYDDDDPGQDEVVVELIDWLEGEKLPGLYDPNRQEWIEEMAEVWLEK